MSSRFAFVLGRLMLVLQLAAGCGSDTPTPPSADASQGIILPPETCDIAAQNCSAATDKCTVALDDHDAWSSVCRTEGTVALGDPCTRETEGNPGVGRDNCARTLYCTAFSTLSGDVSAASRRCRRFCRANASCGPDEICRPLTRDVDQTDGICVPRCTPLTGSECTGGAWCVPISDYEHNTIGECQMAGSAALGEPCSSQDMVYCSAGNLCLFDPASPSMLICSRLCDMAGTIACPTGLVCTKLRDPFPTDFGACDTPPPPDAGPPGGNRVLAPRL